MDPDLITFCNECGEAVEHPDIASAVAAAGTICCKPTKTNPSSRRATPSPTQDKNTILNDSILKFTVSGKTVSKSNSYRVRGVGSFGYIYKTKSIKDYEQKVGESATRAVNRNNWLCSDQPISINVKVYNPDGRKRDLDNIFKALLDALQGIVYYDDSQIVKIIATKLIDRNNPRVEMQVKEVKPSADQIGLK